MADLFLNTLNVSLSAGYVVLAVILLRFCLKKAPKWVSPVLWAMVGMRLIFPFSIESVLSLLPSAHPIPPDIAYVPRPAIQSGIPAVDHAVNPVIAQSFTPAPAASANPLQILLEIGGWLWLAGVVIMLLYTACSYLKLRRRVQTAVPLWGNIYQCETVDSPFVLGLFRPRIYLPFGLGEKELSYIVAHEEAHIRRRDHWWKPIGFFLLSIHWFNPLLWLAYILLCRDIELACDERVIRQLGREGRADYSQALLTCSVHRRAIAACPLAFGEVGVKERVKSVLKYKRPLVWVVDLSILACAIFAICFLTNPPLKLPFMEEETAVSEAILSEHNSPAQAEFSPRDREDLGRRLHNLKKIRPFDEKKDGGIAPTYHLAVTFENGQALTLDGDPDLHRDTDETVSEIILEYDGKRYRVEDPNFSSWMYGTCARKNIAQGAQEVWGINLSTEKISPTSATLLLAGGEPNLTDEELLCSNDYTIQKWGAVGWVDLPQKKEPHWAQAVNPVSNSRRHFVNWEWLYGELPDGKYRIGKKIWYRPKQGGEVKDIAIVWSEFMLGKPTLNLEEVLRLSKKGEALSWQDFEGYPYEDIGSGLYIRRYDLEDPFSLRITAGNPNGEIQSMALCCEQEDYAQVDIRRDDIDAFLQIHQQELRWYSDNHWGLGLEVTDLTPTGCSAMFWNTKNEAMGTFTCNEEYVLQTKNRQGKWVNLPQLTEPQWSSQNTFTYAAQEISWEQLYGALPDGEYRLGKQLHVEEPKTGRQEQVMVYAEFGLHAEGTKGLLTVEDLTRLLEKAEDLDWDDFEGWIYSDAYDPNGPENMQYMRHYAIPGSLRLHLSGPSQSEPLRRLLLQCGDDEDMAILRPWTTEPSRHNEAYTATQWDALGMKAFLKLHSRPRPNEDTNHLGLTYALESVSPQGATVRFEENMPVEVRISPSDQYRLWVLENGQWVNYPTLPGEEWPEESYQEGNPLSETINWTDRYGVLPAGTYRLSRELQIEKLEESPLTIWLPQTVFAEFTIQPPVADPSAVTMTVQKAAADHLELKFQRSEPLPEGYCFLLGGYTLDRQVNGVWQALYGEKNPTGSVTKIPTDVLTSENGLFLVREDLGNLSPGRYRIGEKIAFGEEVEGSHWVNVYAEFTIEAENPLSLEEVPYWYSPAEAELDGYVVTTNGETTGGQKMFLNFAETAARGEEALVGIADYYPSVPDAEPGRYIHYLSFDDSLYTLRWLEEGQEQSRIYRYLKHYEGQREATTNVLENYEYYVLTNNNALTLEEVLRMDGESRRGNMPHHFTVYCVNTIEPKHPRLPADPVSAVLEFDGTCYATVTAPEVLAKIYDIFYASEVLGYTPKNHTIYGDLKLILTYDSGETAAVQLDPAGDICRISGDFCIYSGYDDAADAPALWKYLGIQSWPEAVYVEYPNAMR